MAGNGVSVAFSLIYQAILTRSLGPSNFGNYTYLLNQFTTIFGSLDFGLSSALLVKSAQNKTLYERMAALYLRYFGFVFGLVLIFVLLAYAVGASDAFWPNLSIGLVTLSCIMGFASFLLPTCTGLLEISKRVPLAELIKLMRAIIFSIFILMWFLLGSTDILKVTVTNSGLSILACIMAWKIASGHLCGDHAPNAESNRAVSRQLFDYCRPLIFYSLTSMLLALADRWVLQRYGGSSEQAYFAVFYQLSNVMSLAISAMTSLLQRELAAAAGAANSKSIRNDYLSITRGMLFVVSTAAIFCAVSAKEIVTIVAGSQYIGAAKAGAIMLLYPIYQVYGQLNAALFYATNDTRNYARIGVSTNLLTGVIGTLCLVASGGSAVFLAIKMVASQFIGVSLLNYFVAQKICLNFRRELAVDLMTVTTSFILAMTCRSLVINLLNLQGLASISIAGTLYLIFIVIVGRFVPPLSGQAVYHFLVKKLRFSTETSR